MLHIFYGEDDFSRAEAVRQLEAQVGSPEVREPNTHRLTAQGLTLATLRPLTQAPPFLSDIRLVIVEGLLTSVQGSDSGRAGAGGRGRGASREKQAEAWKDLDTYAAEMPPTTTLLLIDGGLQGRGGLLARLTKLAQENPKAAQVREFAPLEGPVLSRWVRDRAEQRGARLSAGAVSLLVELVGGNLWIMASEIEKLALYAPGRVVDENDVRAMVTQAREASLYAAVDAIVDGRLQQATPLVQRLLAGGTLPSQVLIQLQRSLHQLVLAKEGAEQGLSTREIGQRINVYSEYVVGKLTAQARRMSWARLSAAYQCLADTDLALKTSKTDDELAIALLVADLCALK